MGPHGRGVAGPNVNGDEAEDPDTSPAQNLSYLLPARGRCARYTCGLGALLGEETSVKHYVTFVHLNVYYICIVDLSAEK